MFCLVIVASIKQLSAVPANVYGYAAIVGYSLHQLSSPPSTGPLQNLTAASFANPLVLVVVSLVFGALLGFASNKLSGALTKKA